MIADAEDRLDESGVDVAWLACVIERAGGEILREVRMASRGDDDQSPGTPSGQFALEVWRYEKSLKPDRTAALDCARPVQNAFFTTSSRVFAR